jgi:hypothetical protein
MNDVREGQPPEDDDHAQQYFPHPSPVVTAKKQVSLWSFVSSFTGRRDSSNDDKRRLFKTRQSSDTLLPTTYSSSHVIRGGNSNAGNLHQRNVNAAGSTLGEGRGMMRRKSKGHSQHKPHSSTSNSSMHNNTPAKTCSSFLLGGQYYPGKDKKRRAMRRRTLWYRICCSSPPRKFLCWVVVLYFLGNLWLFPLLGNGDSGGSLGDPSFVWRIKSYLLGGSHNTADVISSNILDVLQYDTSLQFLTLRQEQVALHHIESERSRLQFETRPVLEEHHDHSSDDDGHGKYLATPPTNARQQILERIAPLWFHRNDASFATHLKRQEKDKLKREASGGNAGAESLRKKKKHRSKAMPAPHNDTAQQQGAMRSTNTTFGSSGQSAQKVAQNDFVSWKQRQRILTFTGDVQAIAPRTIHNMQAVAANRSSCISQQPTDILMTTLVIQTSSNRLWILKETCQRWKNPIIAVVFVPSTGASLEMVEEVSTYPECSNLQIIQYMASVEESIKGNYPVNRLRNVGLDHVVTSHVMVMDVDFVPSRDLDQLIIDALKGEVSKHSKDMQSRQRTALIIPAFERQTPEDCETEEECARYLQQNSSFLPRTFDELRACYLSEDCIVFQSDVNVDGHSTTRSHEWIQKKWYDENQGRAAAFRSVSCFHTARYEPYVVLEWCPTLGPRTIRGATNVTPTAPYYDERFYGYGKNKIELISHLRKSGYRFKILPEGFIIHNPHPESSAKEIWNDRDGSDLHSSMDALYSKFMKELDLMYGDIHNQTIKLCR